MVLLKISMASLDTDIYRLVFLKKTFAWYAKNRKEDPPKQMLANVTKQIPWLVFNYTLMYIVHCLFNHPQKKEDNIHNSQAQ